MVSGSEFSFKASPLVISRTLHRDLRSGFMVKPDGMSFDDGLFRRLSSIVHMASVIDSSIHVVARSSGRWIYGVSGQVWDGRGSKSDKVYIGTRPNVVFIGLVFPEHSRPFEVDDDCLWDLYDHTMDSIWRDENPLDDLNLRRFSYRFTVCHYRETRWFEESLELIDSYDKVGRGVISIDSIPRFLDDDDLDYIVGKKDLKLSKRR